MQLRARIASDLEQCIEDRERQGDHTDKRGIANEFELPGKVAPASEETRNHMDHPGREEPQEDADQETVHR